MDKIEKKYEKQRIEFAEKLLELLPAHDWNEDLLQTAEKGCGFNASYYYVLFPEGLSNVVDFFEDWQDNLALEAISNDPLPKKIRDRVGLFLKQRIKQIPQAVHKKTACYFACPDKIILGQKIAWRTCDRIWKYAGDKSTDYNHHTKRALLMSVYLPAIMFFIADSSKEHQETDGFITNSLERIVNFASMARNFKIPPLADLPIFRMFL